MKLLNKQQQHL